MAQAAIQAIEAWRAACDPAAQTAVDEVLRRAKAAANVELVKQVNARAAMHGLRAVTTAWTDVADDARKAGAVFSTVGSCDTHLISKPAGAMMEMEPTLGSAKVAATIPLSSIYVYDGKTLQDYLLSQGVRRIPRTATVKVKACLVYSPRAEVSLRVRAYHGVNMSTYALLPSGDWSSAGIRQGSGALGMGAADGKLKAFDFAPSSASGSASGSASKHPFGPVGASLTTARNDVLMTFTLFRGKPTCQAPAPIYRSLGAAMVTASETDLGATVDAPTLHGGDVDGVVVELYYCKVISDRVASAIDVDDMCRETLATQVAIGGAKTKQISRALDGLAGTSYCPEGHGPYPHGSTCPECGALCVCF